jgi:diadenosine tetraphosphatase ApaH/serine/threonine PP2A family protein phosphatase
MIRIPSLRAWLWALGLLLGLPTALVAQPLAVVSQTARLETDDGPHVLWEGPKACIYWVRGGHVEMHETRGKVTLPLLGIAAKPLVLSPKVRTSVQGVFPTPEKILAVSDVHGRFDTLLKLLKAHRVVDESLQWTFGKGHLVILGDVMDRGSGVTEALWFLRALQEAARSRGGRVHMVPGNHEVMVASGDLRYLHTKYAQAPEGLPAQPELFGPNSELGRWLRSRPVLLKVGDFLFVHGGISPELVAQGWNLPQVNNRFRAAWGLRGRESEGDAGLLLRSKGPIWYRGMFPPGGPPTSSEAEIAQALAHFKAKAVVVGHTTLDQVTAFWAGKVFGIDAGILEGRPGEVWLWEQGRVWRGKADGTREALQP